MQKKKNTPKLNTMVFSYIKNPNVRFHDFIFILYFVYLKYDQEVQKWVTSPHFTVLDS